jgi:hypothetical protein
LKKKKKKEKEKEKEKRRRTNYWKKDDRPTSIVISLTIRKTAGLVNIEKRLWGPPDVFIYM